tara:strand:- start:177 stop:383 length:207 start_codon:yes stop_codon:yes gene_type:complete
MSGKHGAGKGDSYRKVDQSKWDEGWEKAFGKKKNKLKNIMQPGGVYDMTDIPQPENKKQWYEKDTKND